MSSIPEFFKQDCVEKLDSSLIEDVSRELSLSDDALYRQSYEVEHIAISHWINEAWRWVVSKLEALEQNHDEPMIRFATAIAGLTRNLVVGSAVLQNGMRPSIELMLKMLWHTSAVVKLEDTRFDLLNRRLTQALANLLTSNPASIEHAWPMFTQVDERQSVLLRLTYSKDHKILLTIAILLINSIHNSPTRIQTMCTASHPIKILTQLLERLDELLHVESPAFEIIVALIREILKNQDLKTFYQSQKAPSQPVSPSQLAILKVLETSKTTQAQPLSFLLALLASLIQRLFSDRPELEEELKFRVWQAIVLISSTVVKLAEEYHSEEANVEVKNALVEVVKASLSLLRQMPKSLMVIPVKEAQGADYKQRPRAPASQLRIALVQLLSALCHVDRRVTQDTVRLEGGLSLVLQLTVLDPDQPYLREHALFLIRNVLLENSENQAVIRNMEKIS